MKTRILFAALLSMVVAMTSCDSLKQGGEKTPTEVVLDTTRFELPVEGGEFQLRFVPTSAWTATCEESFVSFDPQSGELTEEEVVMTVKVGKNKKEDARTAKLILVFETNEVEVTIDQEGKGRKQKLDETDFTVSADGEEIEIEFTAVSDWEATWDADWITVDPEAGDEGDEVVMTIEVDKNKSDEEREAEITLAFKSNNVVITITQEAEEEVVKTTIDKKEYSISSEGGDIKVEFTPKSKWSVVADDESVLSFDPEQGSASKEKVTLTVTVPPTDQDSKRTLSFGIKFDHNTETIKITQDGLGVKMEFDETAYEAVWRGESLFIEFDPVSDWSASTESDFVTVSPDKGVANARATVELKVKKNTSVNERTAYVKFSFENNDIIVSVAQEGRPADTELPETAYDVAAAGDRISITFTPTTNWKLSFEGDFVSCNPLDGYAGGRTTVIVTVDENTSTSDRSATLHFSFETNDVYVTINQEGKAEDPDNPDDPSQDGANAGTEDVNKGEDVGIK